MPTNPKNSFLKRLEDRHTIKRVYGQNFYELNSTATLYFRYSKAHGSQFFFGVESDDVLAHKDKNLFILFICEAEDEIVVLPIEDFLEMVEGSQPISNQWKITIAKQNISYILRVARKGKYDVTANVNQFDFRPRELRTTSIPAIGKFTPTGRTKEKPAPPPGPISESLADRLVTSSSDSKHPLIFETTVSEVFEKLGFRVKHIGGAGNTDILLEAPIRGIVDCKSTAVDSINHLNLPRLKRHKKENDGSFLLVVSKGFARAVVRDAEMEQCALMPVTVLRELLMLSKSFTFSPFEIEPLLNKNGLVEPDDFAYLREMEQQFSAGVDSIVRVIGALDFEPRALKEIKGRLDYEAEATSRSKIDEEEVIEILSLLSSPVVSIAQSTSDGFSSRYSRTQSLDRLGSIFRKLLSPAMKE